MKLVVANRHHGSLPVLESTWDICGYRASNGNANIRTDCRQHDIDALEYGIALEDTMTPLVGAAFAHVAAALVFFSAPAMGFTARNGPILASLHCWG